MIDDSHSEPYDSPPEEEALLTQQEAAEIFGVSRQTFTVWRRRGLIPTYRIGTGRHIRFKQADVLELKRKFQLRMQQLQRTDS